MRLILEAWSSLKGHKIAHPQKVSTIKFAHFQPPEKPDVFSVFSRTVGRKLIQKSFKCSNLRLNYRPTPSMPLAAVKRRRPSQKLVVVEAINLVLEKWKMSQRSPETLMQERTTIKEKEIMHGLVWKKRNTKHLTTCCELFWICWRSSWYNFIWKGKAHDCIIVSILPIDQYWNHS